jgi:spermidine synthase
VCNYTRDNGDRARAVVDDFVGLLRPEEVVRHDVPRDKQYMYEYLNGDFGFFIRSAKRLGAWRTKFQDLEIHDSPQFGKLFRLDGCFMTSEKEEFVYHECMIHPAAVAHPAPKKGLIIGGGDGGAAEELLKHPSMESVTLVELDGDVIDIARQHFGAIHRGVFDDPRLKLVIDDGLKFLAETDERFDLIVLDLPDPIGPATALYEEPFFRDCRRALAPGGAVTLHIGPPWSKPERVRSHAERLANVFPIVRPFSVYIPLYGTLYAMAVCSDTLDPLAVSATEVEKRLAKRGVRELRYYNGAIHHGLFALPNFVRELVAATERARIVPKRRAAGGK